MTRPDIKVEIAFNASYATPAASRVWTDVTDHTLTASEINIGYGRQNEFSQPGPNTCTLTLDNRDGRFTPGLATSPYYPNVKLGRPLRVAVALLSAGDHGTFEANATGWTANNATATQSTLQAHSGTTSLRVVATASASMSTQTAAGISGIPVTGSASYRASAWYRSNGTSRSCDLRVDWYDATGTLISTSTSAAITDSTTWQQINSSLTSPATAAFARVRAFWTTPAASEVHYLDDVRLDVDRFVGFVDEWPLEWPATVSTWATSTISASSRMARMGSSAKLKSVGVQDFLAASPSAYYPLSSLGPATTSPVMVQTGAGVDVTFDGTGPSADGGTAAAFTGGKHLHAGAVYTASLSGAERMISCFFATTVEGPILALRSSSEILEIFISSGNVWARSTGVTHPPTYSLVSASTVTDGNVHHVAFAFSDNISDNSGRLIIDGVQEASDNTSYPTLSQSGWALDVGFAASTTGTLTGAVSHVAMFTTPPTATRLLELITAATTGFAGETAVARLGRYAGWANVASTEYSFSSAAVTPMAHIDSTGQAPVELTQKVAETDGGVLYDSRSGVLTYLDRGARYTAATVLTLDASTSEVQVGYVPKLDRAALINKVTATLSDGTYSVTAEDTASSGEYGVADPGGLELATTDADEAHAAAWWRVNTYATPAARAPQLGVELANMTRARQAAVLAVGVSKKVAVANLPAQSDASTKSFFVEGYTETITDSLHKIEFNVSSAAGFDVWTVEDPVYGQYDAYPTAY
jgi:hypothetical protein